VSKGQFEIVLDDDRRCQATENPITCVVSGCVARTSPSKIWKETWDPAQRVKLQ
jgi:hypothetical protein